MFMVTNLLMVEHPFQTAILLDDNLSKVDLQQKILYELEFVSGSAKTSELYQPFVI